VKLDVVREEVLFHPVHEVWAALTDRAPDPGRVAGQDRSVEEDS
jgi:hypothetical protein